MEQELADSLEALHADAFGWALHCCGGDSLLAEDVLQNAYLKAVQGRIQYAEASSLKTWWFGVIRFTAREDQRRQRYRESLLGRLWQQLQGESLQRRSLPPLQIELDEQTLRLQAALSQLPPRQAEVLHLVFYQDLTLSQTATVMKIGIGSVRQHYERGKARLRILLQPTSDDE